MDNNHPHFCTHRSIRDKRVIVKPYINIHTLWVYIYIHRSNLVLIYQSWKFKLICLSLTKETLEKNSYRA